MSAEVVRIPRASPEYPVALRESLGDRAPGAIWAQGSPGLLKEKSVALLCSIRCPGNLILKTYDLARSLRDAGVTVIGGFHSPMERECLDLLLRGRQPVIVCAARGLTSSRLIAMFATSLKDGRLLFLSPFGPKVRRATADTAVARNEVVAALADRVFVPYASGASKTEALCRKVVEWGKPLLTFHSKETQSLLALGAMPCDDVSCLSQTSTDGSKQYRGNPSKDAL